MLLLLERLLPALLACPLPQEQHLKLSSDQVGLRFISQLINSTSKVLQKLVQYFNGTTTSTSFMLSLSSLSIFGVFPVIMLCILMMQSLLWDWHYNYQPEDYLAHLYNNSTGYVMSLSSFHCTQSDYTTALQHLNLLRCRLIRY